MFREIFTEYGMDASYMRIAVREAADAVRIMREIGLAGMNVTAPFKEQAFALADDVAPAAKATGIRSKCRENAPICSLSGRPISPAPISGVGLWRGRADERRGKS